jgi:hypothetical protein
MAGLSNRVKDATRSNIEIQCLLRGWWEPLAFKRLCHNMEKTDILKEWRGGRVEKI